MKIKKIVLITLIISSVAQAIPNNPDFARRFGSNSHIYNTPLYFNKGRCRTKKPSQNRTYRKKIKKEIAQKTLR